MAGLAKKLSIAATVAVGMTAIGSLPAFAGSLTNPQFGGTAATDYLLYCSDGSSTFAGGSCTDSLEQILTGNSTTPGGNIELAKSSEQGGFDFTKNTSLSGTIGGKNITVSSLTQADWFTDLGGGVTLLSKWLDDAFAAHSVTLPSFIKTTVQNAFVANGGMQKFSDPNISYVNQNDTTGKISIGLAGHLNASSMLKSAFGNTTLMGIPLASLVPAEVQASEIVKVVYDNGPAQYLYNFVANDSGQVNDKGLGADGISHNGNYEVTLAGVPPVASVPEPSTMLGLMAVGGVFSAVKRKSAKNA